MRIYGYNELIGLKITQQAHANEKGTAVSINGFDVSRNFAIRSNEQILAIEQVKLKIQAKAPEAGQSEAMLVDQEQQE